MLWLVEYRVRPLYDPFQMTVVGSSVDPLPSKSVMTNDRVCVGDLQNEWTKDGDNTHAYTKKVSVVAVE